MSVLESGNAHLGRVSAAMEHPTGSPLKTLSQPAVRLPFVADPELELLLHCARRELTPAHTQHVRRLLQSELDWRRLMSLARRHNMLPLLYWHVKAHIELVPPLYTQLLYATFLENAARMLMFLGEVFELTRIFHEHGLSLVPYKGPALSADLYGNLALRQSVDIDLLVGRRDLVIARELLLARGYRPRHHLTDSTKEFMVRGRYHEEFVSSTGTSLELHWAFTNGDVRLPLDLDTLRPNLRTLRIGGSTVSMFGYADMLLILCIHGCKHRFDRLEWICGVAETLRAHSDEIDWEALHRGATSLGVRRMLLLGLLLAYELLEAPVPQNLVMLARSDSAVSKLAAGVPASFVDDPAPEVPGDTLAADLFRLQLRERFRDRLQFVWYRLTTPSSPKNWYGISIGAHWIPMHALFRPVRVLVKLLPAFARSRVGGRQ